MYEFLSLSCRSQDQKKAARGELETINKSREAMRQQVKGMKERMKHTTVEKIDEQVRRRPYVARLLGRSSRTGPTLGGHAREQQHQPHRGEAGARADQATQGMAWVDNSREAPPRHPQASRGTVAEYNQRLNKLTQDDAVRDAVVQRIKDADDRLTKLKVWWWLW